jgi:hybrid cluster-associated redox disulfide protein
LFIYKIIDFYRKYGYNIINKLSLWRYLKMVVTKQSIIGDVLDYDRGTAEFFLAIGMHCLGCPASRGESIEAACNVHGTNADELVEKLNAYLASKN